MNPVPAPSGAIVSFTTVQGGQCLGEFKLLLLLKCYFLVLFGGWFALLAGAAFLGFFLFHLFAELVRRNALRRFVDTPLASTVASSGIAAPVVGALVSELVDGLARLVCVLGWRYVLVEPFR